MKRELVVRTERAIQSAVFYDIVNEWEDEFCQTLHIPLFYARNGKICGRELFLSLLRKFGINIEDWLLRGKLAFAFQMFADSEIGLINSANTAICIIDFYPQKEDLRSFYEKYQKAPFLFISSREAFEFLLQEHPPRKIYHLPLSLPDKYRISPETRFNKKFDVALIGRQNKLLVEWLKRYCQTYEITYVYRKYINHKNQKFLYYTNKEEYVCNVVCREDYFGLIRQCKIAFYSTPGMEGDPKKNETHGFSQVTPRFLELLSCGCLLIGQYPKNADIDYYKLDDYVMNVHSYNEFEKAMNFRLQQEVDMVDYSNYLESHYTSVVAKKMVEYIRS